MRPINFILWLPNPVPNGKKFPQKLIQAKNCSTTAGASSYDVALTMLQEI